jgi:hypothetical protein
MELFCISLAERCPWEQFLSRRVCVVQNQNSASSPKCATLGGTDWHVTPLRRTVAAEISNLRLLSSRRSAKLSTRTMATIRRRLRLWVATWLVFQVASLWVLVSGNCCAAQRSPADAAHSCHDSAAATHCAIPAVEGTPCPMHPDSPAAAGQRSSDRCSMRGTCDGPMAALVSLLSNHGVLTDSFAVWPDLQARHVGTQIRERLISGLASPDPPPPRA